eukprot:gnl/MRDRNA2_/MRDRNA2_205462_c0_seq1.p1 gnl/MRDRNA2_/MRDRNA2_205462_c0~~gnl/MRDRNA2_/MRDRNA2_205462_c0_seq1.p1  ORF type:complete len:380 (+),score=63.97 gnl/MRDRNA2_/MRDRNA2_205462_c0_seq1:44-1141(+)
MGPPLVRSLLQRWPDAVLYCLHRGAASRIEESMQRHGCWDDRFSARLRPVQGDLAQPNLGLLDEVRDEIVRNCSLIVHAAAEVQHLMGYLRMKPMNVTPVIEMLRLCGTQSVGSCVEKRFVYVSTISVLDGVSKGASEDESAIATEEEINQTHSGYAQSKWVAESLVREACVRGFDCQIWRLGLMSPDSTTGASNLKDWMMRFVCCCAAIGSYCGSDNPFHVTPVDYAADAVVKAASLPRSTQRIVKTFHMPTCQMTGIGFLRLFADSMAGSGCILREVGQDEWGRKMDDLATSNPLYNFRASFRSGLDGCANHEFTSTLQDLDLEPVPRYTQEMVDEIVAWLMTHDESMSDKRLLTRCASTSFT